MAPLTQKQKELLDYLCSCERSPSFEEIKNALGLKSKSGVHRLVVALEERGAIRRLKNRARAIEIISDPRLPVASIQAVPASALASEAKRRGLVLGRIFLDAQGARRFEAITA